MQADSRMLGFLSALSLCIPMSMGQSKEVGWIDAFGAPLEITDVTARQIPFRRGLNPDDFQLDLSDDQSMLFSQLEAGDRARLPRAIRIPGVGLQYTYRRH